MTFTSAPLLALWILPLVSSYHGQDVVTAYTGQDVTLKCEGPNNTPIIVLEWTRPDLHPEYIFFYRDERSETSHQNPSFAGRVELSDREMKNGDLSLILKNVNRNDAGTYECRVATGGARRTKRANINAEPTSIINLKVKDAMDGYSDAMDGGSDAMDVHASRGHAVVGAVFAVVAITGVIVGGLKFRKHHEISGHLDKNSDPTSADEASDPQLV